MLADAGYYLVGGQRRERDRGGRAAHRHPQRSPLKGDPVREAVTRLEAAGEGMKRLAGMALPSSHQGAAWTN